MAKTPDPFTSVALNNLGFVVEYLHSKGVSASTIRDAVERALERKES